MALIHERLPVPYVLLLAIGLNPLGGKTVKTVFLFGSLSCLRIFKNDSRNDKSVGELIGIVEPTNRHS